MGQVGQSYGHPMCTTVRDQIPLSIPSHVSHVGQVGLSYGHPMCTTVRDQITLSIPSHVSHVRQVGQSYGHPMCTTVRDQIPLSIPTSVYVTVSLSHTSVSVYFLNHTSSTTNLYSYMYCKSLIISVPLNLAILAI